MGSIYRQMSTTNDIRERKRNRILEDALKDLNSDVARSRVNKSVVLANHLDVIHNAAYTTGLTANELEQMAKAITTQKFTNIVRRKLVHCLVPSQLVPESCVIRLLSWITTGLPTYNVRGVVLRWIIVVYDYIDNIQRLHSLYTVIFFFLRSDLLRRHACQLLYMMTRKEHCTKFRARHLLKLRLRVGSEPQLDSLLSLYKLFYPDYLPTLSIDARKAVFRNPDRKWIDEIKLVRDRQPAHLLDERDRSMEERPNPLPDKPSAAKRARFEIPPMSRAYCHSDETSGPVREGNEPVAFVTVKSFHQFCRDIHRLQIPGRVGTALSDTCLLHYVSAINDMIVNQRLSYWLQHSLYEVLINDQLTTTECDKEKLLDSIAHFCSFLQESVPVCDLFLECYLMQWDGHTHRRRILDLLAYQTRTPVSRLQRDILTPLRMHFVTSPPAFKCDLLDTLTRMLRRIASSDWSRYIKQDPHRNRLNRLFDDHGEDSNPVHVMRCVTHYVDELTRFTLPLDKVNLSVMYALLSFYECVSRLYLDYSVPFIQLIPSTLIYHALFSSQSILYDFTLRILAHYKLSVVAMKQSVGHRGKIYGLRSSFTERFNALATNILPLTRRSSHSQPNLPQIVSTREFMRDRSPQDTVSCLSVYRHSAYAPHSLNYLPINTRELRAKYMSELEHVGLCGVTEFRSAMVASSTGSISTQSNRSSPRDVRDLAT